MRITLRDIQTGKTVDVEASGATFGRDAARCHVVIADKSVSNLHARVFAKDGRWYVEDQGSSNGTYVGGKRSSGPIEIKPGDDLAFFRYGYKVVGSDEAGGETALFVKDGPAPAADGAAAAKPSEPTRRRTPELDVSDVEEVAAPLTGAALVSTFKRGLAHFVQIVPQLGLKPLPTARATVESQRSPAMEKLELAAFVAPALVFGALVAAVCAALAGMLRGLFLGGLLAMVTGLLVGLAVAAVAALLTGWLLHPVLGWLVTLLRGQSTPVSRTNYAVASFAAGAVTQIVGGVGLVIGSLPVPFINLVPLLLGLFGTLVALYVSYVWLRHFAVMSWVPLVVLAFMLVSGLLTASGLLGTVRGDLAMLHGGATVAEVGVATPVAGADAAAPDASGARPSLIERGKGWFGKGSAPAPATAALETQPGSAAPPPAPGGPTTPAPDGGAPGATPAAVPAPAGEPTRTPYAEYQRKLEAVEKAVAADPTLLSRAVGVKPLYRKLHEELARFKKKQKGEAYEDRLRQAEVYEATVGTVDELYAKAIDKPVFAAAAPATDKAGKKKTSKKTTSTKSKTGATPTH